MIPNINYHYLICLKKEPGNVALASTEYLSNLFFIVPFEVTNHNFTLKTNYRKLVKNAWKKEVCLSLGA